MRIVGGRLKGRVLAAPGSRAIRPTSERLRESIFDILEHRYPGCVEGRRVVDLFAGSGALAIEALSRGAGEATLVDSSPAAIAAIRRNLTAVGIEAEVRHQRAATFLEHARTHARQYDLVFLDPPYRQVSDSGRELSQALPPVLAPAARVVAESDRRAPLRLDLTLLDERRYGDTLIRIHRYDNVRT